MVQVGIESPPAVRSPRETPRLPTRAADAAALALLSYLVFRIWFDLGIWFDLLGAVAGAAGIAAALVARQRIRTFLDGPLIAYAALTLLSVAVTRHRFTATGVPGDPLVEWRPAIQTVALTLYFYGATWILRTERRRGWLVAALVVAVSLVGARAANDHAYYGFDTRLDSYITTQPWLGYPDIGLLFAIALPVPLAVLVTNRSIGVFMAAAIVAVVLFLDEVWLYSRGGYLSMVAGFAAVAAVGFYASKRWRLAVAVVPLLVLVLIAAAPSTRLNRVLTDLGDRYVYGSRFAIWQRTVLMISDYPLLGVGPGHYYSAMRSGYEWRTWEHADDTHAHNMLLHIAAETGVPAAAAFLLVWVRVFQRLWSFLVRRRATSTRAATLGLFGALVAFFVRGLTDYFFGGFFISERLAFLMWTLLAAAVAAVQSSGTAGAPAIAPAHRSPKGDGVS